MSVKQKIAIIVFVFLFFILPVVLFLLFSGPVNKYDKEISINGYDKYISNMPANIKGYINNALYLMVEKNLKSSDINVTDANIRANSVDYDYNNSKKIHSGSFVVDMKSIKQSYLINYSWPSIDTDKANLYDSASIKCLPVEKLIYGKFNCLDYYSDNRPVLKDPIFEYLPYSAYYYYATTDVSNDNIITINVNISLSLADKREGNIEKSIAKYKAEFTTWMKSKNLNPDSYIIKYTAH